MKKDCEDAKKSNITFTEYLEGGTDLREFQMECHLTKNAQLMALNKGKEFKNICQTGYHHLILSNINKSIKNILLRFIC